MSLPDCQYIEEGVTLNELFEALSHPARRRILLALVERNCRTMGEFAVEQSGPECQGPGAAIELTHVHLPRLNDAGLVDWNPETETITRGQNFEELRPHLDALRERH